MDVCEVDEDSLRLTDLPVELLLHILQFLEVKFISEVLSQVSDIFRRIAADDSTWRIRIQKRWPGQYPALPSQQPISWTRACIDREEENKIWRKGAGTGADGKGGDEPDVNGGPGADGMKMMTNSTSHYASVDAVHVMQNVVVSGSRDRSILLWPTRAEDTELKPLAKYFDAHKGWVWSFCSQDDLLISGDWDSTMKFWTMSASGLTENRSGVRLKTAILTTDIHENRIVAGTFANKVVQLDAREESKKLSVYKSHSRPVLKVKITSERILSLSEDSTLVVYDRVAGKKMMRVELPRSHPSLEHPGPSFPLSMDLLDNMLYIGDSTGHLHLLDTTHDSFSLVETYKTGHSGRVTSVVCGYGSYLTSSSDGTVRIHQPSRRMGLIANLQVPECGQVTSISYKNQVLAAAGSNNTVSIWSRF